MEELLASMHDLTGGDVLPVLAAHMHAAPRPMPRLQHPSAGGASVSQQLIAVKALQKEGARVFSDGRVRLGCPARHLHFLDRVWKGRRGTVLGGLTKPCL